MSADLEQSKSKISEPVPVPALGPAAEELEDVPDVDTDGDAAGHRSPFRAPEPAKAVGGERLPPLELLLIEEHGQEARHVTAFEGIEPPPIDRTLVRRAVPKPSEFLLEKGEQAPYAGDVARRLSVTLPTPSGNTRCVRAGASYRILPQRNRRIRFA